MSLDYVPARVPVVGEVLSVILQMSTFGALSICLMRRTQAIKKWAALPLAIWLVLIIYTDSALFVFATAIVVHGLEINSSREICEGGILLCLVCYMTTKILIYYFLVERAYVVRGSRKPRLQSKLWLFNCLFMILPYTVFVIMNFIFRITYINDQGVCIIGMQKIAMLPLIIFEVIVNVYLTLLFILPIRNLYSYKQNANPALNRMAFRSFIGSCATLTTSVVNLTILMVLKGEPGWICLMCCNADILFCILVLHWVTSKEHKEETTLQASYGNNRTGENSGSKIRSRRRSMPGANRDVALRTLDEEKSKTPDAIQSNPFDGSIEQPQQTLKLPAGTIITECKSDLPRQTGRRGLHRGGSSWDARKGNQNDDEVELHNIRVQTIHTREVEIESDLERGKRSGSKSSTDGDEWVASAQKVVGERIV